MWARCNVDSPRCEFFSDGRTREGILPSSRLYATGSEISNNGYKSHVGYRGARTRAEVENAALRWRRTRDCNNPLACWQGEEREKEREREIRKARRRNSEKRWETSGNEARARIVRPAFNERFPRKKSTRCSFRRFTSLFAEGERDESGAPLYIVSDFSERSIGHIWC